jgi:beta-glucosidase
MSTSFRDLNKNGRLDLYEDPTRPIEERVSDLLSQMTLEEKAGLMFHPPIVPGPDGNLVEEAGGMSFAPTSELVGGQHLNHFNLYWIPQPRLMAEWVNNLQRLAEGTRLGIPVTLSSDPRHSVEIGDGAASMSAGALSEWPEPIGLAAAGDAELVRRFGDVARQEYVALGIRVSLHPMADLATEPRWSRIFGTFGEDADLASRLLAAYITGFQGETLGPQSVACMTKHFPGGGPQKDGEDPHFPYGKDQVYPGNNAEYHLKPFEAAFAAGTAQMMPYYGRPIGTEWEEVGFGFNHDVITGLLRGRYGFDGVVCTDWGLIHDIDLGGTPWEAKAWGVEHLSFDDRVLKAIEAGCDQFGGEHCPEIVVGLVRGGRLSEERIDESARRILRDKFRLGLFDDPYIDPDAAERIVGGAAFREAGREAQRRTITLLHDDGGVLPLAAGRRLYVEGVDAGVAAGYGELVERPEDADVAILRLKAPFEPRNGNFIESLFRAGDLDFKQPELDRILGVCRTVPTVVDVFLDRPAVLTEVAAACAALMGSYGSADDAVLDVVFGRAKAGGKLPFELPRSMDAVRAQHEDVPHDSADPLYAFGHGL